MERITLHQKTGITKQNLAIPSSKSESNRALILNHYSKGDFRVENLSSAEDTQLLARLLKEYKTSEVVDCGPAGTTFRFLTTVLAFDEGEWTLTGSQRMKERPIKELVDALKQLGADITYLENEGYPPLKIKGVKPTQNSTTISMKNSSQYASSLLLSAPFLPEGLEVKVQDVHGSESYLNMTLSILEEAGFTPSPLSSFLKFDHQQVKPTTFKVESDWSGASYWYSFVALNPGSSVTLLGLKPKSLQGDRVLEDIYLNLGVLSEFTEEGVTITQCLPCVPVLDFFFNDCPDIAQTVFVTCLALGVEGRFSGLHSLRIKETDRIAAMQTELAKVGGSLTSEDNENFVLAKHDGNFPESVEIDTYHDHRMAMAFAPLAAKVPNLVIKDPKVVGKSYPTFWDDVKQVGIEVVE